MGCSVADAAAWSAQQEALAQRVALVDDVAVVAGHEALPRHARDDGLAVAQAGEALEAARGSDSPVMPALTISSPISEAPRA